MEVTSRVEQGFRLGPDLWNASYDSLLTIDMPEESHLVGYADDVAAHGFNLALEKTDTVILIKKRIPTLPPISFRESIIESKPTVKYLGLTLDSGMSFFEELKQQRTRLQLEFRP